MSDPNESLILEHREYVRALARQISKMLPPQVDFNELVALGELGLVEAARQFDAQRGASFTTFAYYRIRGSIFDGLRKMTWLPPAIRRKVREEAGVNDVVQETTSPGQPALPEDPEALATRFAEAVSRLGAVFLLARGEDDAPEDPADPTPEPGSQIEVKDLSARLRSALRELPEDQSDLLRMLYFEGRSMAEVGAKLGKNKSTVCRRHADAIESLRQSLGMDRAGERRR